jgi:hypothetical protein
LPTDVKLSVLVCGLYERMPDRGGSGEPWDESVLFSLIEQAEGKPVQLLTIYDNRVWTVGQKRNRLLAMAEGEYFTFVDDDDEVAPDYIDRLLDTIQKARGADVLTFRQDCIRGDLGGRVEKCRYGLYLAYRNGTMPDGSLWWEGKPAHTMCWRTDLVQDVTFPDGSFGEDVGWVAKACAVARTEYHIPNWTGYTYHFNPEKSRTRGR